MEEFKKLGLSENMLKTLKKKGFEAPTLVQKEAIPLLLSSQYDVVGHSQTGTGKTASFAIPIIEKLKGNSRTVEAIVLTPTRELAIQVSKDIESMKGDKRLNILAVYGGSNIREQMSQLRKGVDIVVGTPGRVMDLMNRRYLMLDKIQFMVLDEADEMLNMGFVDDIKQILSETNSYKKMLLFSATMPRQILAIAKKFMGEYKMIEIQQTHQSTDLIKQICYSIAAKDRVEGLKRIIDLNHDFHGIVFCNTKHMVDSTAQHLAEKGYNATALHGDISQAQREKILKLFRTGTINILVATDVAARGIDVNNLTHVINFSVPQSPEAYTHRIGRTGRAGKEGTAITFVMPSEVRKLRFIEKISKIKIEKQKLPSVKELIELKKNKLQLTVMNIIEKKKLQRFTPLAEELLDHQDPIEVVSAILKYVFKNEFNPGNYKDLKEVSHLDSSPRGGKRRNRGRSGKGSGRGDRGRRRNDRKEGSGRRDDRGNGRGNRSTSNREGKRPNRRERRRKNHNHEFSKEDKKSRKRKERRD